MARRRSLSRAVSGALALVLVTPLSAAAEDWPQFRGPRRDGISLETGILRSWAAGGPRPVWRRSIGEGFSGIAVRGDRVYTMALDGENEVALCLRAADGERVWATPVGPKFLEEFGNGPRSTPAVDGERVYALSSTGKFVALAAADGKPLWEHDLVAEYKGRVPQRGYSPSPLVDGDLVLLEVGGAEGKGIIAFEGKTGKVRWSALESRPGYSSPIIVTVEGVKQYVFAQTGGSDVVALRSDGQVHWKFTWPNGPIAMPVFVPPNRIFVSTANDVGGVLIEIGKGGDGAAAAVKEVWASRDMKNHFNSSVYHQGHIYGFDNATLKAIDATTGTTRWAQRGFGKGSLVLADGLLLVLSDRGHLALVEATPEAYRELGKVQAVTGKAWTGPSVAGGKVFVRDQDEIVALDLKAAAPAPPAATTTAGAASTGR